MRRSLDNGPAKKRLLLMQQGAQELQTWLEDAVRQGLAALRERPDPFWEKTAQSLVDTKLPGLARRVRLMASKRFSSGWLEVFTQNLAELYTLARVLEGSDTLPPTIQEEVLQQCGWNLKKDLVREGPGLEDLWLVAGKVSGKEDRLRFEKHYLLGGRSGRVAYLLDYAWGNAAFPYQLEVGAAFFGELVFYPGAFPLRALLLHRRPPDRPIEGLQAIPSIADLLKTFAKALSRNPWLEDLPVLLGGQKVIMQQAKPLLIDAQAQTLPLDMGNETVWTLVAAAGTGAVDVFGLWDGFRFRPLSVVARQRIINLGQEIRDNTV